MWYKAHSCPTVQVKKLNIRQQFTFFLNRGFTSYADWPNKMYTESYQQPINKDANKVLFYVVRSLLYYNKFNAIMVLSLFTTIFTGLLMLIGLIMYISIFKAEIGSKLRPRYPLQPPMFQFRYGQSFFLYVIGFISTEFVGVLNVFLFISLQQIGREKVRTTAFIIDRIISVDMKYMDWGFINLNPRVLYVSGESVNFFYNKRSNSLCGWKTKIQHLYNQLISGVLCYWVEIVFLLFVFRYVNRVSYVRNSIL